MMGLGPGFRVSNPKESASLTQRGRTLGEGRLSLWASGSPNPELFISLHSLYSPYDFGLVDF